MKRQNTDILIAIFLVIIAAAARAVNQSFQLHNFVPIAAISLFSGAIFREKRAMAFLVPLLGQFLADAYFQFFTYVPGFYSIIDQSFNYGAILAATALGVFFMKGQKPLTVFGFTLGASGIFFLLSNLGYFAGGWNGYSFSGLVKTYVDAVAFYRDNSFVQNPFVTDMVGSVLLFGGYALTRKSLEGKAKEVRA